MHPPPDQRSELWAGLKQVVLIPPAALVLLLPPGRVLPPGPAATPSGAVQSAVRRADFSAHPASPDARFMAGWAAASGDSRGLPFIILDKRDARVFVFAAEGRLIDSSPV